MIHALSGIVPTSKNLMETIGKLQFAASVAQQSGVDPANAMQFKQVFTDKIAAAAKFSTSITGNLTSAAWNLEACKKLDELIAEHKGSGNGHNMASTKDVVAGKETGHGATRHHKAS